MPRFGLSAAGEIGRCVAARNLNAVEVWRGQWRDGERGHALSVVGFDDRHFSSTTGLTTLHPPIEAMGEAAASLVLRRLATPFEQGHIELVLDPTLVVRSSTRLCVV